MYLLDLLNSCSYAHVYICEVGTFIVEIVSPCLSYSIQYDTVPLVAAVTKGHTKIVQRLLEAGANVNRQDRVMTIILHISIC